MRRCTRLNGSVVDVVVIKSDQELRVAETVTDRSLRRLRGTEDDHRGGNETDRRDRYSDT